MVLALGVAGLFSGCAVSTISSRAEEKTTTFATATEQQQRIMRRGWIDRGFSPDMVFIALGKPDAVARMDTRTEVWVYKNFNRRPHLAAIGKPRIIATQDQGPVTDVTSSIQYDVRPDMSTPEIANEIPSLYVYFEGGSVTGAKVKRA